MPVLVMDDEDITWPVTKGTRKALAKGEPSGFSRLQDLSVVLSGIESFTASNIEAALQLGPMPMPREFWGRRDATSRCGHRRHDKPAFAGYSRHSRESLGAAAD